MALTSSPDNPQPLRTIVQATKSWVERLGAVWVEGQIIEIKRRAGQVQFLTLRDSVADISVSVTTTASVLDAAGPLPEGTVVAAWLKPQVWLASGRLSFDCHELRPLGLGRLLAAIEQRKRMLQAEGLFAVELKRRLPFLPRRVGLITGAGSAAERDVVENARRRWPATVFEIRHVLVQGPQASEQVLAALLDLDAAEDVDVIVIARGGGSVEDLLPFNDEALARAVHKARTPVVSAIGHESDTPILDLVADVRASTPTDAAKRVVPDAAAEAELIRNARQRAQRAVLSRIAAHEQALAQLRERPVLRDPAAAVSVHREQVADLRQRARRSVLDARDREAERVAALVARARALSPKATLARGYAILARGEETLTSAAQAAAGDKLLGYLHDGRLTMDVESIEVKE
ncbi:MAG: exodeoxyribonuclease VII large subunit [Propionibacteriaceae bacterium]|jgi:exodeoxyribonuclease VII large subunit|nr:exodeoxyribonuclease VII large subunit [Propionibacteriaceae bacterium]